MIFFLNFTWLLFVNKRIYSLLSPLTVILSAVGHTGILLETFASIFTSLKVLDFPILYSAYRVYSRSFLYIRLLFYSLQNLKFLQINQSFSLQSLSSYLSLLYQYHPSSNLHDKLCAYLIAEQIAVDLSIKTLLNVCFETDIEF